MLPAEAAKPRQPQLYRTQEAETPRRPKWFDKLLYLSRTMGHTTIKATAYYYNLVPLFADQLNELSGSGLTEILPDLTDYYTNEEE